MGFLGNEAWYTHGLSGKWRLHSLNRGIFKLWQFSFKFCELYYIFSFSNRENITWPVCGWFITTTVTIIHCVGIPERLGDRQSAVRKLCASSPTAQGENFLYFLLDSRLGHKGFKVHLSEVGSNSSLCPPGALRSEDLAQKGTYMVMNKSKPACSWYTHFFKPL